MITTLYRLIAMFLMMVESLLSERAKRQVFLVVCSLAK